MAEKVIITGASGFVGSELMRVGLKDYALESISLRNTQIEDIDLSGVSAIVHLAGIAHRMGKTDDKIYFDINRDLTISLAKKAKSIGVKQFIFLSTSKVYGDILPDVDIIDETTLCQPDDAYGQSKWEAEKLLNELSDSEFKVAIIRPPLIYGPNVKGNLKRLMKLIKSVPLLPFKGIRNNRSMVYVGNLIALIETVLANNTKGTFIAGDKVPYSTSDLAYTIKKNLNSEVRFFKIPRIILRLVRILKPGVVSRLFDSYVVDNSQTNKNLDFVPPYSFDQGILEMVKSYQE